MTSWTGHSVEPLTDTFGRRHTYLRIALTERCNLRCTYCMPADGVDLLKRHHLLTFEEILRLAGLFAGLGVTRIRLTGGEPLVRKDAPALAAALARLPGVETLAITTNGLLLHRHLDLLQSAGLAKLNISLDTLREERFLSITRRTGLETVIRNIDLALASGFDTVKLNCVVMRDVNDGELIDFAHFVEDRDMEVRFIEYMPFGGNGWNHDAFVPYATMLDTLQSVFPDMYRLDDGPHETAKTWQIPGFRGRIGFITSMSEQFCGGCNRIRLMADGNLKVCLFGRGEVSLRDAMRDGATDEELTALIDKAISGKKKAHDGMSTLATQENRPMIRIGG
ncbi:MAG: GTP 3',8-cyclase MoaA [Bacteroidetes bacterium CG12_big_fil_rev_8_21_14_0_65_60_17]|nr:MAG: GTP 3',8-cyclase MoaA [Bacteroidetes bacterium CG12_big_fil_rev_8_21_14_0_65_60_17]